MKKHKKHAMALRLLLLLGVAALLFSSGAYAFGGIFSFSQPRPNASAATSSGSSSSSVSAMRHSNDSLDLFPMQIGRTGTSALSSGSSSTRSSAASSGQNAETSETDTSRWNPSDKAGRVRGKIDNSASQIYQTPPATFRPAFKPTAKPTNTNSQTKPAAQQDPGHQPNPLPKPSPTPQPKPLPVPQPTPAPNPQPYPWPSPAPHIVNISAVKLEKTALTLKKGDTSVLKATIFPADTTQSKAVTWSSSNEKVAVVDKTGKITAVEGGSAKISAKASNGVTGVCIVTVTVPATKVSLNLTNVDLGKGDSRILTPAVEPMDTTDTVNWATSNNDIVAVDNAGKITAVTPGTTTITATVGSVTASCKVTVGISITQIKLSETDLTVKKGESNALSATIVPLDATEDKAVTWTSSDDKTATVDKEGNVTGIENGTAIITAQAGTHTAQCTVHVLVPATGISLDKKEINIDRGSTQTLTAKISPDDTTVTNADWFSTDETVATVDNKGKVTGVSTGSTVITVKSRDGGFTVHCTVHVVVSITGIHLSESALTLKKGKSHALLGAVLPADTTEDKTIKWASSDPRIASVDTSGNVTAVEGGTTTITLTVGKHTAICDITVVVPVTGIKLDNSSLKLTKGTGATLIATLNPGDSTDKKIMWTSSNPDVAVVDESGQLQTVSSGQATITATSHDGGFRANCTISVVIPVTGLSLDQPSLTLRKGNTIKLTSTIAPANATDQAESWTTSNPGVATVDSAGNVTAVGGGNTVITATTHDGGYSARCSVNVSVPVTGITLDKTSLTCLLGESNILTATITPSDATDQEIIWSSSDNSICTVDQNGTVTSVGYGKATITASTHNGGFTANCIVDTLPITYQGMSIEDGIACLSDTKTSYQEKKLNIHVDYITAQGYNQERYSGVHLHFPKPITLVSGGDTAISFTTHLINLSDATGDYTYGTLHVRCSYTKDPYHTSCDYSNNASEGDNGDLEICRNALYTVKDVDYKFRGDYYVHDADKTTSTTSDMYIYVSDSRQKAIDYSITNFQIHLADGRTMNIFDLLQ